MVVIIKFSSGKFSRSFLTNGSAESDSPTETECIHMLSFKRKEVLANRSAQRSRY